MPSDMMTDYALFAAAMIFAGVLGGFIAGLLGVGGGIVIVPVLYFVLGGLSVDESIRMKIAVATSLSTILFTSLSSAGAHYRKGSIDFALLKSWAVPVFIGVVAGTALAAYVSGIVLTAVFAIVALLVAVNMTLRAKSEALADDFPNRFVKAFCGFVVGAISAMMGIGGGTLSVPIQTAFGCDIRKAVGTAAAIGFIIAIPGAIGYMIAGWNADGLPAGSLGFVNLVALGALIPLTMGVAPLGAKAAHAIPKAVLSYSFAVFLALTSMRMLIDLYQHLV
ncbi:MULTISPECIES: sulfite exporter TauE/SafE family protein [Chelativorans]|uniref:Probable membrane transporter protein n=1 Tax=Chelativorans sp. (strain BNC1) TaxID=266779 RepID=Q11I68_CHESB|nr:MULTISPECIES: sulfite exporter TauE/SafE family protein [Chelativorans]